jgi:hypothetical protein
MQAQHKVSELSPEDCAVVERLLGRELKDDEVVQVNAQDEEVAAKLYALNMYLESGRKFARPLLICRKTSST